jgi:hypothetical protein
MSDEIQILYDHEYTPNPLLYPDQTFTSFEEMATKCPLHFDDATVTEIEERVGTFTPYKHRFVRKPISEEAI